MMSIKRYLLFCLALALVPPLNVTAAEPVIREFRFTGNTVFTSAELAAVTAPHVGRTATREELEDARRAVTLHYVHHGYINSGAILITGQNLPDGVVTLRVVEGVLTETKVDGNHWLRTGYLTGRIRRAAGMPLNVDRLQDGLQSLRLNPNVRQINAELKPGALPGQSRLAVRVQEENPFRVALQVDNTRPPSVGSTELQLMAVDRNLTGHGDALNVSWGIVDGGNTGWRFSEFDNAAAGYALPLNSYNTTFIAFGSKSDYAVIEEPFNSLNITSDSYRYGVTLRQPLYQTSQRELALAVTFERRHSKTFLLGVPFDVTPGSVNGVTDISALRFSQEWTDRSLNQVIALRSTFSIGLDVLDVTDDGSGRNAKFFSWLGQAQYVRRLFNTPNQLILRADGQVTDRPLLSMEQFTLGGVSTVRGYRENQLVRDQGVAGAVEFRVPVLFNRAGMAVVQLAPFFDLGAGWNNAAPTPSPTTLYSAGMGVLFTPNKHVNAQFYWGYPFTKIDSPHNDPQDAGFHFRVTVEAF